MLKKFLIPTLIIAAAVAVPVFAQRPLRQRLQRPAARQSMQLGKLRNALNLTPAQIDQLKQIREANQSQRQAITQEMQQKRHALRELMAQSSPDPAQVGNAMLGLKDAQKRSQQLRQQAMESFKRSLTPDQLQKLEELQSRAKNNRKRGI